MNKKRTVVVGFCREVSLLHTITTLLQKGYEVVAFDSNKYAPGLKIPGLKGKFVDPSIEKTQQPFAEFLLAIGKKYPGSVLLTGDDETSLIISKFQYSLKEYFDFLTPTYEIFSEIINKYQLAKLVENSTIKIPRTCEIADLETIALSYPLMLKPKIGAGGRQQIKCLSHQHISNFLKSTKKLDAYFAQEYIPGPINNLYTVNLIMDKSSNPVCAFSANRLNVFRSEQIPEGVTTFIKSVNLKEQIRGSIEFLKKIKWVGIAELEFKKDENDKQIKLLEINPRLWSWTKLATICGVNFPCHYVQSLTNNDKRPKEVDSFTFAENIHYLRLFSDLYSNFYRVSHKEWSLLKFIKENFLRIKKLLGGYLFIENFENIDWMNYYFHKKDEYL